MLLWMNTRRRCDRPGPAPSGRINIQKTEKNVVRAGSISRKFACWYTHKKWVLGYKLIVKLRTFIRISYRFKVPRRLTHSRFQS